MKSRLYSMAEGDMGPAVNAGAMMANNPNARCDGRRSAAAADAGEPDPIDFFKYRLGPAAHLLQSANHALKAGLPEKMVLACLVHDISTFGSSAATTATGARNWSSPTSRKK